MKYLISIALLTTLAGCNTAGVQYRDTVEFDWMPSQRQWEHNISTCRSQPTCNAADLFQR